MPENWVSDFMAMCCGLSLALALGWNVTAGTAEWKQLAQNLCLVENAHAAAVSDGACKEVTIAAAAEPAAVYDPALSP